VSSCAGFISGRVLEFKFEGKRPMGRPRRRWFSQLLEDKDREELTGNRKVKTEDYLTIDPCKIETMLEEEGIKVSTS
jgi:hypothetical protein